MKNILKFLCIISFILFSLFSVVWAKNIMPVEVANPDKILVEDMDTTFYIIINDNEIKENVVQMEITFFNEYDKKITIPYNGENVLEVPFHIPSRASSQGIGISIEGFYENYRQVGFENGKAIKEKILSHYFRYQHEFNLYKKIPTSIFPSIISDKYSEELGKIKLNNYRVQTSVGIPNHAIASYGFIGEEEDPVNEGYSTRVEDIKENFKDTISLNLNSKTCENTYKIIQDETESSDPYIDNIIYSIGCGYQCNNDFQCAARIIAKHKHEAYFKSDEDKTRFYYFYVNFNSSIHADDTITAEEQGNKFISEMELFAKNITLTTMPNMEYKELKNHSFSAGKIKGTKYDYSYKNEIHSSIYKQIMEGDKPKIETPKKKTNIAKKKFEIKFKDNLKTTIRNTGVIDADSEYATVGLSMNIQGKAYDKDGNEIKDVSDEDLFADTRLVCVVEKKDSQIGFLQGANIIRTKQKEIDSHNMFCDVVSKGPRNYTGPYSPLEFVSVYVAYGESLVSNNPYYTINVEDMTPEIELKKNPIKIQDYAEGIFRFQIKSDIHKGIDCKIKIPYDRYAKYHIPTIKISQKGLGDKNLKHYLRFPCEANIDIPIRVKPPLMGNFDVLGELNKLSMVALQEGTAVSLVSDLIGVKVEKQLNKLKKAKEQMQNIYRKGYKNAKVMQKVVKFDKALKTLGKANDYAGKVQNAIKIAKTKSTIEGHIKDSEEALDIKENKGTLEKVADTGVWAINGAQTVVGAVMMAPEYIPIIGKTLGKTISQKVGAKFILAFNLMTNVWKGNLQYISKSEKIDRAKEKTLPIPIIIEIETKEGFITQNIQIINVLYTWLDK